MNYKTERNMQASSYQHFRETRQVFLRHHGREIDHIEHGFHATHASSEQDSNETMCQILNEILNFTFVIKGVQKRRKIR